MRIRCVDEKYDLRGFQSPSNRVNIPNFYAIIHKHALGSLQVPGFNPLVIGSIFQTTVWKVCETIAIIDLMFQSPSNRVNIPNS